MYSLFKGLVQGAPVVNIMRPGIKESVLNNTLKLHCVPRTDPKFPVEIIYPSVSTLMALQHLFRDGESWSHYGNVLFKHIDRMANILIHVIVLQLIDSVEPRTIEIEIDDTSEDDSNEDGKSIGVAGTTTSAVVLGLNKTCSVDYSRSVKSSLIGGRKAMTLSAVEMKKSQKIKERTNFYINELYASDIFTAVHKLTADFKRSMNWMYSLGIVPLRNMKEREDYLKARILPHTSGMIKQFTHEGGISADEKISKIIHFYADVIRHTPEISCVKEDKIHLLMTEYGGNVHLTNYNGDVIEYLKFASDVENRGVYGAYGVRIDMDRDDTTLLQSSSITELHDASSKELRRKGTEDLIYNWGGASRSKGSDKNTSTKMGKKGDADNASGIIDDVVYDFTKRTESFVSKMFAHECKYKFAENMHTNQNIKTGNQTMIVVKTASPAELAAAEKNKLKSHLSGAEADKELTKIEKTMSKQDELTLKAAVKDNPTLAYIAGKKGIGNVQELLDSTYELDNTALEMLLLNETREDIDRRERINTLNAALISGQNNSGSSLKNSIEDTLAKLRDKSTSLNPALATPILSQQKPSAMDSVSGIAAGTNSRGCGGGGSLDVNGVATRQQKRKRWEEKKMEEEILEQRKKIARLEQQLQACGHEFDNMKTKLFEMAMNLKVRKQDAEENKKLCQRYKKGMEQLKTSLDHKTESVQFMRTLLTDMLKQANMSKHEREIFLDLFNQMSIVSMREFMDDSGYDHLNPHTLVQSMIRMMGGEEADSNSSFGRRRFVIERRKGPPTISGLSVENLMAQNNIVSRPVFPMTKSYDEMSFLNSLLPHPWMKDRLLNDAVLELDELHKLPPNIVMDTLSLKIIDVNPNLNGAARSLEARQKNIETIRRNAIMNHEDPMAHVKHLIKTDQFSNLLEGTTSRLDGTTRLESDLVGVPGYTINQAENHVQYMNTFLAKPTDIQQIGKQLGTMWQQHIIRELALVPEAYDENGRLMLPFLSYTSIDTLAVTYASFALGHVIRFSAENYLPLLGMMEKEYQRGSFDGSIRELLNKYFSEKIIFVVKSITPPHNTATSSPSNNSL